MEIRKSSMKDEDAIMRVFARAKQYMDAHGNPTQWEDGYPGRELLRRDILSGSSYVFEEKGAVAGTFSLILGEDPTYRRIDNGAWHANRPYGTIHRLASDGTAHGLAGACFTYCLTQIDYLRIDTHQENLTMQAAIERFGFRKCGIIYVRGGSARIAYDYLAEDADTLTAPAAQG